MKKPLHFKLLVLGVLLIFNGLRSYAQEIVPLAERVKLNQVQGDLTMIGNSIVGLENSFTDNIVYDPNAAYNGNLNNGNSISAYIDIDGDATTFSSSSADLITPNPSCTTIAYAGLYWSATYYLERIPQTELIFSINNTAIAGNYSVNNNTLDPGGIDAPTSPGITADLVLVQDSGGIDDGCGTLVNTAELNGNIAVLRRGFCSFTQKILNVQNAGAVAVIIVNNGPGNFTIAGGDAAITIPAVSVSQEDGNTIITEMSSNTVNATLVNSADTTTGDEQLTNLPLADARKVGDADFRNIKVKVPGGSYIDVTATSVIYDGYRNTPTNPSNVAQDDVPYVCYADITNLIDQNNTNGTFTIANMNATIGQTSGVSGAVGGWTLVIVYEDPQATPKFISTNDGFVQIVSSNPDVDFTYTGVPTLPAPLSINAKFGISSLEGDQGLGGDRVSILNTSDIYESLGDQSGNNPSSNFFNSSITNNGAFVTNRNPNSQNTLGYDIDIFDLPNPGNSLIGNNQENVGFRLRTDQDSYRVFLTAFATENIEPELLVIKRGLNTTTATDITGSTLDLGDELFYELAIENVGNENFLDGSVIVSTQIPANMDLVNIDDASLPAGVVYDQSVPGKIDFVIPSGIVETTDAPIFIRYRVRVINDCASLRNTCSENIQSSATSSYIGEFSGISVVGVPSSTTVDNCGVGNSLPTSFLLDIPACSTDVTTCTGNLQLVAGLGYDRYTWSGPGIVSPIIQTGANANILDLANAQEGTYTVSKEDTNPADGTCVTLTEEFNVSSFRAISNPILDYVNGTSIISENCSGIDIPQILLCGDQDFLLETNFDPTLNLVSISWQRLAPSGACASDANDPCSLLSGDCTDTNWVEEPGGNTPSFTVSETGDYRILAEFDGGCFNPFYFSVSKTDYQPELTMQPIECGNAGSVEVTNAPLNFEFSLNSGGPYSNTTVFPIPAGGGGDITVYAIDTTFPGCEYTETINVPEINPTVQITATDPTCINDANGDGFGRINIEVIGGLPEYQYTISGGNLSSPIVVLNSDANNGVYTQTGLAPGTYTVEVVTNLPAPDCVFTETVTINSAPDFTAEAVLIAPETCDTGALVQVNVTSGAGDYQYDDGSNNFQTNNVFEIPIPADPSATYAFFVTDTNVPAGIPPCIIEANITGIETYSAINIDNVETVNAACATDSGEISIQVSPTVAGRTYTYRLVDTSADSEVEKLTSTERDITFDNVVDGFYYIEVLHNNTSDPSADPICAVTSAVQTVTAPSPIDATVSVIRELSCSSGTEDAIIRVDAISGGSGSYEWSFSPTGLFTAITADPYDIPVSTAGNYALYIRNQATGDCFVSFDTTVAPLLEIDDINATIGNIDCNTQNIEVTVSAAPAGPTYLYSVTPAPISGDANTGFFVLDGGVNYTVTAQRSDNSCTLSKVFTFDATSPINNPTVVRDVSAINAGQISCNNPETVIVSITEGVGPFLFEELNGVVPSQTVAQGTGDNGATVGIETTAMFTLSNVGSYTFRITDLATGCNFDTPSYSIDPFDTVEIQALVASDITCFGDSDGSITIEVSGYTGSYDYNVTNVTTISGTGNTNAGPVVITNLLAGLYTVEITASEAPFCNVAANVVVSEPQPITASFTVTDPTTQTGGQIEIDTAGGTPPYFYTLTGDGIGPITATSNLFVDLDPGNYLVSIDDSNSCRVEFPVTLQEPVIDNLEVTLDLGSTFINCYAQSTAVVSADVTGGTGNYQYTLTGTNFFGNTITVGPQSNSEFRDLAAGNYNYTVESDGVSPSTIPFVITQPQELVGAADITTSILCVGDNDGTIRVQVTGGTPPYSYALASNPGLFFSDESDGVLNAHTFEGLIAGNYEVLVQDANGCSQVISVVIPEPTPIVADVINIIPETCSGNSDGEFTIAISGGTPPYFTNITNNDADLVIDKFSYSNLPAGITTIFVSDANGCRVTFPIEISEGIDLRGTLIANATCASDSGTPTSVYEVRIELDSNTPNTDVIYWLAGINGTPNPSETSNTSGIFAVEPGEYEGSALSAGGCEVSVGTILVEEYEEVSIVVEGTNPTNPGENGEILVNIIAGNGPFSITLDDEAPIIVENNNYVFTQVAAGDHHVVVSDNGGCSVQTATVTIVEEDKNPIVTYAEEILVCAITGQSYPVVTIQDEQGEVVDLPLLNVLSIVWQKLDEITCDIELEDNCPTSDSVCTSDWFDIGNGTSNTFTEAGEYRVVVNFITRSGNNEKIYYFRVESEVTTIDKEIVAFPNPSKDRVRLNKEVEEVLIYDVMGKLVMKTNQNSYSIAGLRNGIYFAKIKTSNRREVIVKLIKE
ncbi:PA domain-containing protein [Aquimarina spongiae]|uniref:SprB repeat-containing protein n=1 Tax=Aquimarina spongiae TaxID=570521 RepID=A0A1M6FBP4_9FLAO|nr:PA domain-containing protein [Aquimarina spongiae]SHI95130.1 SprB repeat-containing protein [Aquimarina spongiae]